MELFQKFIFEALDFPLQDEWMIIFENLHIFLVDASDDFPNNLHADAELVEDGEFRVIEVVQQLLPPAPFPTYEYQFVRAV